MGYGSFLVVFIVFLGCIVDIFLFSGDGIVLYYRVFFERVIFRGRRGNGW